MEPTTFTTFTDQQLRDLMIEPTGRASTTHRLGILRELSDQGKAEMRRVWNEQPDKRPLFAEEPPASWCSSPTPTDG
jgi:hypothetical protein